MTNPRATIDALLSPLRPARKRQTRMQMLLEAAARFGYAARGFVYLSAGILTLIAALGPTDGVFGAGDTGVWLLDQPFGRLWLALLGVGLWAFVGWRVLQAVFNVDHASNDLKGLASRAGQAMSGLFYGLLASSVFEVLDEAREVASRASERAESVAENQQKAEQVLALPFGPSLLVLVGALVAGIGVANLVRAWREDFLSSLDCPKAMCSTAEFLARAGYAARGFAYLPLGGFIILAGLRARASEVTDTAGALAALQAQPGGTWALAATGAGFAAFGAFAFVEARWRIIRPPRNLAG